MADEDQNDVELDEGEWVDDSYVDDELDAEDTTSDKPELKKLYQQHPECNLDYVEHVIQRLNVQFTSTETDTSNPLLERKVEIDPHHRTYPFLTNFERTKIIGLRANQLSKGAKELVKVPSHITDVRDIARLELEQKRLPFIIKRPLPNGSFEYWRLSDLMIL